MKQAYKQAGLRSGLRKSFSIPKDLGVYTHTTSSWSKTSKKVQELSRSTQYGSPCFIWRSR